MSGRYQVPPAVQPLTDQRGLITNPWWQWALSIGKNAGDPIEWSSIVNTPTTLGGYGITDAYTETQIDAMFTALAGVYQPLSAKLTAYAGGDTPSAFTLGIVDSADAAAWRAAIGAGTSSFDGTFASLTGKPTTLAGYGITDAVNTTGNQTGIAGSKEWVGNHNFAPASGNTVFSAGSILIGLTSPVSIAGTGSSQTIQSFGTTGARAQWALIRGSNDASGPALLFGKTRGTASTDVTTVQNGDALGGFTWVAADGVTFNTLVGRVRVVVDGAVSTAVIPGLMQLETANTSGVMTTRLQLNAVGALGLAGANYGTAGQFVMSGGVSSVPTWSNDGSALTNLPAENLTGSIADARLSANVPLLNNNNVFTGGTQGITSASTALLNIAGSAAGAATRGYLAEDASGLYLWQRGNAPIFLGTNNTERGSIGAPGNWTINAPDSGTTLTINTISHDGVALQRSGATRGYLTADSTGAGIFAGSGQTGGGLYVTPSVSQMYAGGAAIVTAEDGVIIGSPTGGDQGVGSLNAQSLYLNGAAITSGTYTPVATGIANYSGSTAYVAQYLRVGNVVTVSGRFSITAAGAGTTSLRITLPIASNFGAEEDCGGSLSTVSANANGRIYADSTNDQAILQFNAPGASPLSFSFIFTYRIL